MATIFVSSRCRRHFHFSLPTAKPNAREGGRVRVSRLSVVVHGADVATARTLSASAGRDVNRSSRLVDRLPSTGSPLVSPRRTSHFLQWLFFFSHPTAAPRSTAVPRQQCVAAKCGAVGPCSEQQRVNEVDYILLCLVNEKKVFGVRMVTTLALVLMAISFSAIIV